MVFTSNFERIQQRLHQEATTGPYYAVATDPDTKLQTVDGATAIVPRSVIVGEQGSSFGEPIRNRRTPRLERRSWRWAVVCMFTQDVTAEATAKRLIATNILLPRDTVNDLEQVTLKLLDADLFHPPQQNPSSGTQVTLTFEAELAPV